jgi:glutamate synthase (NADPH/NADH) large chain
VLLLPVEDVDVAVIEELLGRYQRHLTASFQDDEAGAVQGLVHEAAARFLKIVPALTPAIAPE